MALATALALIVGGCAPAEPASLAQRNPAVPATASRPSAEPSATRNVGLSPSPDSLLTAIAEGVRAAPPTLAPATPPSDPLQAALAALRAGYRYGQPTPQDQEGRGIWPSGGADGRSEQVYPPYVLAPRRQTDELTRQLYALLPASLRDETAFVIADRVAQSPEMYLPYLRARRRVIVLGNFVGIGEATADQGWFVERHRDELAIGAQTIALAQALGLEVVAVRYTLGDSLSPYSVTVRDRLQTQLDAMLAAKGLAVLRSPLVWGADEMVPVAFASQLPPLRVRLRYGGTTQRHVYDGGRTTPEVVAQQVAALGLVAVGPDDPFDIEALVLTSAASDDGTFPDPAAQRALDALTLAPLAGYSDAQRARLAIIDARMFNGAWDAAGAPPGCGYLAYGSWGTLANKAGTTLATAKIVWWSRSDVARRQLYLEAFAHDVYANGYVDGRDRLAPQLAAAGVLFAHFDGYDRVETVATVFGLLNRHVNESMAARFDGTPCLAGRGVRLTPQLWRTFESETHLRPAIPGEVDTVGVYRADLDPAIFDPRP